MALVEREPPASAEGRPVVELLPGVVRAMAVKTARVERGTLWKYVRSEGTVAYDVDRVHRVHLRTPGWIQKLYVRSEGERVKRMDNLADYFSPLALAEQVEYLSRRQADELSSFQPADKVDQAGKLRLFAGRNLLLYLGVPEMSLMSLDTSRRPLSVLPVKTMQSGVVVEHNAREGMYAEPADTLFTIVDISEVWVMVEVHEPQLAWVRPGVEAEVTTPALPGRTWSGKVEFVYPEVHPRTRTLRARIELSNPDEALRPNMFVEAVIYGGPKRDALVVPSDAVIVTGEGETAVKVVGEGRFQPVEVRTGIRRGAQAEVLSGLAEGDEVVVSGQFLIDSESSLRASLRRMAP
jgi:Cu(I)/Ag(I) efflux system membrane fusion protein